MERILGKGPAEESELLVFVDGGICSSLGFWGGFGTAEDGHNVFNGNDEKDVAGLEIDGDGVLGMEEDLVVFADGEILVSLDLEADFHDATGDGGDLGLIGEDNPSSRFVLSFVLADEDPHAEGFNRFDQDRVASVDIRISGYVQGRVRKTFGSVTFLRHLAGLRLHSREPQFVPRVNPRGETVFHCLHYRGREGSCLARSAAS